MEDADAYDANNNLQRRDAREILPGIISKMRWDKEEVILDFGCGQGFVTKNILKPLIDSISPNNTIYGLDICPEMIDFATANYASPDIIYLAADIMTTSELEMPRFDKIVSLFVLHWIYDQKKVLSRLYQMLKVDGEIGMVYVASASALAVFENMAHGQKWAPFLVNVKKYTAPPTQYDLDPVGTTRRAFKETGFALDECTLIPDKYAFDSFDMLIDTFLALDPSIGRIPDHLKPDYKADFCEEFRRVVRNTETFTSKNAVEIDYVYILIRAKKLE